MTYMHFNKVLILIIYFFISTNVFYGETIAGSQKIWIDTESNDNKYSFYEDKVNISYDLHLPSANSEFYLTLLYGESYSKNKFFIIADIDRKTQILNLYSGFDYNISKHSILIDSISDITVLPVFAQIDFKSNNIKCVFNNADTIVFNDARFTLDESYSLAVTLKRKEDIDTRYTYDNVYITNLSIKASKQTVETTTIYWFYIIIFIDILIFVIVFINRHNKKRKNNESYSELIDIPLSPLRVGLPDKSSIYLFGGLRVLDRDGTDITKRFSPILKELLCLLIINSDKNGISAEKLKNYLWQDKSVASARNNRAVNLGKLRALLADVGTFQIKGDDGNWRISTEDVFIDYLSYRSILKSPGILSESEIEYLCRIVSEGNILPEQEYEWLDKTKSLISDELFDKFLAFSNISESSKSTPLNISIAEVMLKFESINEQALSLKCRTYVNTGRHSAAKKFYDKFCEEYEAVYGEVFSMSFSDILNK